MNKQDNIPRHKWPAGEPKASRIEVVYNARAVLNMQPGSDFALVKGKNRVPVANTTTQHVYGRMLVSALFADLCRMSSVEIADHFNMSRGTLNEHNKSPLASSLAITLSYNEVVRRILNNRNIGQEQQQ